MKVKITVLTPVHIGSGEIITPSEYISIDENGEIKDILSEKVCRINIEKLFKNPSSEIFLEPFVKNATRTRYIWKFLDNSSLQNAFNKLLLNHIYYKIPVSESAKGKSPIKINLFVKSVGRVYIPGSSLKGSILSGVIYKIAKEKNIKNLSEKLLEEVIEESSKIKSGKFSRWLDVSDTNLGNPEESLEISYVEATGGKKKGIPLLYETLKVGTSFYAEIKTSINSIKFGKYSLQEILKMADEFYRKIYQKFNYNFEIPEGEYLLRIGQGSSVLSTSFLLLAEELGINKYSVRRPQATPLKPGQLPDTQKLIGRKIPMGWISVKIADK